MTAVRMRGGTVRSKHRLYPMWGQMIARCTRPNATGYKNYGGRGVTVCDRWMDFQYFIDDVWPTYSEGLTMDRKDNDGNYEPSNCRWASLRYQQTTRRRAGRKRTKDYKYCLPSLKRLSEVSGIQHHNLHSRLNLGGWCIEAALVSTIGKLTTLKALEGVVYFLKEELSGFYKEFHILP